MSTPNPVRARRYASIAEVANYLNVEHKLVRRMIASGSIPARRIPGSKLIRVDLNELDAAMTPAEGVAS